VFKAETAHRPLRTRLAGVAADLASVPDDAGAEAEQTEVQLRALLLVGGLKLEEGHACKARLGVRLAVHGCEILLDYLLGLTVVSVLTDEPRHGLELLVASGHHRVHELPSGPPRVQTMNPPRVKGLP